MPPRRAGRLVLLLLAACTSAATDSSKSGPAPVVRPGPPSDPDTPALPLVEEDLHAGPAVAAAVHTLNRDPAILKADPADARARLPTLGERFDLHRFSRGSGPDERVGLELRPRRIVLRADDLADALELQSAIHTKLDIPDAHPDRLMAAGLTEIPWYDLGVEVVLDERPEGLELARWDVVSIRVLPSPLLAAAKQGP
jgi:hypothetical protein